MPELNPEMSKFLAKIIAGMADDLKPIVDEIEDSSPLTKDHYGRYLEVFTRLCNSDHKKSRVTLLALLAAGGNSNGVNAAFQVYIGPGLN